MVKRFPNTFYAITDELQEKQLDESGFWHAIWWLPESMQCIDIGSENESRFEYTPCITFYVHVVKNTDGGID